MMKSLFSKRRQLTAATLGVTNLFFSVGCQAQTSATRSAQTNANAQPVPAPRPNVLLILADDLGWSDIGCFGSEIRTPNIDALAKGGLSFTQFYNSARCSPTRASLLTGLTPHQAGVANIGPPLSNRAVTIPEVLAPAGYSTSMVGKWHLTERNTPVDRGFQDFYGMLGGFNSYWDEKHFYTRLPEGRPTKAYKPGQFYSTDAFADYSIDFIDKAQREKKPWFQYLAHQAPHFPLHAPEADIAKYEKLYAQGWDKIREQRLERQKKLGLVPKNLSLTPRSVVPKNWVNVQTGWADKDNPAWDSLPADRRADLTRRMAVYAATIDHMDQSIGRVVNHLKQTKQFDNTLILFLSDNGACAEWDPYGFDVNSGPRNILHKGDDLKKVGGPESYISYGSGWANASNTPWRLYKHYAQEGGIRTQLIAHWPKGLKTKAGTHSDQPGWVGDIMPTLLQLCGAQYPNERNGQ
jgi:arylsulfatase A-like enzyme